MSKLTTASDRRRANASDMREYRFYFALIYPICLAEALCARVYGLLRHAAAGHAGAGTLLHDARVRAHAIVPFIMAR